MWCGIRQISRGRSTNGHRLNRRHRPSRPRLPTPHPRRRPLNRPPTLQRPTGWYDPHLVRWGSQTDGKTTVHGLHSPASSILTDKHAANITQGRPCADSAMAEPLSRLHSRHPSTWCRAPVAGSLIRRVSYTYPYSRCFQPYDAVSSLCWTLGSLSPK